MTPTIKYPLRHDLPPLPARIAALPVDARGYPVPWFVSWNDDGTPEFRVADGDKLFVAIREKRCWVCGDKLGVHLTFVLGSMCAVNRVSAEPPCHKDCAEFSVQACPFLSKPHMVRRENDLPENMAEPAGIMIRRNPGCTALWHCRDFQLIRDGSGVLFRIGEPSAVTWWREGRAASRSEVMASIDSGLPLLQAEANAQGALAVAALSQARLAAERWLPVVDLRDPGEEP